MGVSLSEHLAEFRAEQAEVRRMKAVEEARMVGLLPGGGPVGAPDPVSVPAPASADTAGPQQVLTAPQQVLVSGSPTLEAASPAGSGWLAGQNDPSVTGIQPVAGREALLVSFRVPPGDPLEPYLAGRSWTYDNAVGAIALLQSGNPGEARQVLAALQGLMNSNGTLGFSYAVNSRSMDGRVRTGTMAFVGYAMAYYQRVTGDASFQANAERVAAHLKTLQLSSGLLKGGPDVSWVSTEHNVDAYFFHRELYRVTGQSGYLDTAGQIRDGILANLWTGNNKRGRFLQGLNDPAAALDANALGVIFLSAIGETGKAGLALKYIEDTFKNTQTIPGSPVRITGYAPDSSKKTVWLEGTLQVAAAYQAVGNGSKARSILSNVSKVQSNWESRGIWHGALPYALPRYMDANGDTFSDLESVAATSWRLIAQDVRTGSSRFWDRD